MALHQEDRLPLEPCSSNGNLPDISRPQGGHIPATFGAHPGTRGWRREPNPQIKLLDWRGRREELEASSNPFALVAAATLAALETRPDQPARLERALRFARLLLRRGFSAEEVGGLFYLLEVIMPLNKQLDEVFTREVAELEKRHARQLISPSEQRGRRQGRLEGKAEGRVEGRLEGKLEVVRALLASRFGELPEELDRALTAVREPQVLDRLAVQALSLGSAREIVALLVPEERGSAS